MKKIFLLMLVLAIIGCTDAFADGTALATGNVTAASSSLYGGPDTTAAASSTEGILIGKLSTNVILGAAYDANGYAINTKHTQGDKAYGTADDATALYVTTLGTGALTAAPSASDFSAFSSWTEL